MKTIDQLKAEIKIWQGAVAKSQSNLTKLKKQLKTMQKEANQCNK